nr:hypothetical protein [Tanacetum cinerariifolium]
DKFDAEKAGEEGDQQYVLFLVWSSDASQLPNDLDMPKLEDITYSDDEDDVGTDMAKITKKKSKPNKNEHEIVKSIQIPDVMIFSAQKRSRSNTRESEIYTKNNEKEAQQWEIRIATLAIRVNSNLILRLRFVMKRRNQKVKPQRNPINSEEYLEDSSNAITPILPNKEPEYFLSMGYEHLSTTPEIESDEVVKSSVKNLIPIPREYEVTSNNESECDVPVCEDSFDVLKDHSEILSDSNNDDTSSDEDAFEDIEYVEASELVSLEEENDVYQEEKEIDLEDILQIQDRSYEETRSGSTTAHANNSPPEYDSFCFEIEPDQGRLTSVVMNDISDNSTNDPLLEEVDLVLVLDNSIPSGIENFDYDSKGDIYFFEELLSNDSLPLSENESSNLDHHDDPSFPRPPPKPPDVEFFFNFEPNSG